MYPSQFMNNSIKLTTSAALATCITVILILLMRALIHHSPVEPEDTVFTPVDILMPEKRKIDVNKKEPPVKPVKPQPQPATPPYAPTLQQENPVQVAFREPAINRDIELTGPDTGAAIPVFRIAPEYPRRAAVRGVEGFVELMFDVAPSGKTENIRILYAEPEGYFEGASVNTLRRWKYKPAMDDGVPVPQRDQTTRIVFELQQ